MLKMCRPRVAVAVAATANVRATASATGTDEFMYAKQQKKADEREERTDGRALNRKRASSWRSSVPLTDRTKELFFTKELKQKGRDVNGGYFK